MMGDLSAPALGYFQNWQLRIEVYLASTNQLAPQNNDHISTRMLFIPSPEKEGLKEELELGLCWVDQGPSEVTILMHENWIRESPILHLCIYNYAFVSPHFSMSEKRPKHLFSSSMDCIP